MSKMRQRIERSLVRRIVSEALKAGYEVSVDDGGEGLAITRSTDIKAIMDTLLNTDEDRILVHRAGEDKFFGWVFLVYGNSGWDVINDYITNLEEMLKPVNAAADKMEELFS